MNNTRIIKILMQRLKDGCEQAPEWNSANQQLLAAEQEAQQIVNTARAAKSARLRQAKEESEREIAEYRSQMEAEFQRKVAESRGDSGANVKRLQQVTAAKIEQLNQQAASISPEVIQMLLRHVTMLLITE